MDFPWIPLLFSLTLLLVVLFVCRILNAGHGKLLWNGALIYFAMCFLAMVLDFTLTMVFASASFHDRVEYESIASRTAWTERLLTYAIPLAISLLLGLRFRQRQRFARLHDPMLRHDDAPAGAQESVTIQTSPYTQSELTLR